jgi:hypothetical protein
MIEKNAILEALVESKSILKNILLHNYGLKEIQINEFITWYKRANDLNPQYSTEANSYTYQICTTYIKVQMAIDEIVKNPAII